MLSRTNTCNGYIEDSDSSDFMYNNNNNNNTENKEESIGSELSNLSDEVLNEALLKKYDDKNCKKNWRINDYICALIYIIAVILVISITLFAIYKLKNSKKYLYNYSVIGFVTTLCLMCCLCSCVKYRTEIEFKNKL
jgi:hypothetical protein